MDALRTPDDRCADLPDFSFAPHYVQVDGCQDSASRRHEQGGHFLQEDKGRELAGVVVDFVNRG